MITLALDASTYTGTVAVLENDHLLAEGTTKMRGEREERLMPAVEVTLGRAGVPIATVDRIVCGAGPGSFTSLRIAGAIAKGLATGRACPLFAVSSLLLIAAGASEPLAPGRYIAALDAMRGECFALELDMGVDRFPRLVTEGRRISQRQLHELARRTEARIVGPGFEIDRQPHARGVSTVDVVGPVDLVSWEPDYGRASEAQVRWEAAHGRRLESI